jgi:hypothetical protein
MRWLTLLRVAFFLGIAGPVSGADAPPADAPAPAPAEESAGSRPAEPDDDRDLQDPPFMLRSRPGRPEGGPILRGPALRREGGPEGPGRPFDPAWGPGAGAPEDRQPLHPEQIEQILGFTREHFPELHDQLVRARERDGRAFRLMLRRLGPPMLRLHQLWRDNPQEARRVIRVQQIEMLLRDRRQAFFAADTPEERSRIEAEARALLAEKLELRRDRLRAEIREMQARLDEQARRLDGGKKELAELDAQRDRMIAAEAARLFERGSKARGNPGTESRPAPR